MRYSMPLEWLSLLNFNSVFVYHFYCILYSSNVGLLIYVLSNWMKHWLDGWLVDWCCLCLSRLCRWRRWRVCTGVISLAHPTTRHQSLHGQLIANRLLSSWRRCRLVKYLAWIHSARCWWEKQVNSLSAMTDIFYQQLVCCWGDKWYIQEC